MSDTTRCELCGRGMARKALVPVWWSHQTVCDRANCRAAARDALLAVKQARDEFDELIGEVRGRHEAMGHAVGWRDDAHAEIDLCEEGEWWANEIIKTVDTDE